MAARRMVVGRSSERKNSAARALRIRSRLFGRKLVRDYAAYCGISDDGQKIFAIIMQIGRRKPLLKKLVGDGNDSQPACAPPIWDRGPVRVTFAHPPDQKLTFSVKSQAVDVITLEESEGGE